MSWKCWWIDHKWGDGFDVDVQQCERCPKLRKKPPKLRPLKDDELPNGTTQCPYKNCNGYIIIPTISARKHDYGWCEANNINSKCKACGRKIVWRSVEVNYSDFKWRGPYAGE